MSELSALTARRDELLTKIRTIESKCEGIENKNNAKRIQELNFTQAQLMSQKSELSAKLSEVQDKIASVNKEISELSGTGTDKILEAINKQRWYFIKNKPKVLFDRKTGFLWANLDYYNICKDDEMTLHKYNEDYTAFDEYEFDGYREWKVPSTEDVYKIIYDKLFPFMDQSRSDYCIRNMKGNWISRIKISDQQNCSMFLGNLSKSISGYDCIWIPCTSVLVDNTDYERNVDDTNSVYTKKEKLQFTLDLFLENNLIPIFDDEEISELYNKIYFEKPELIEQLQKVQEEIDKVSSTALLSSEFDYTAMLAKYDTEAINGSVLKYSEAVKEWIDELLVKLDYYEATKGETISELYKVLKTLNTKLQLCDTYFDNQRTTIKEWFNVDFKMLRKNLNSYKNMALQIEEEIEHAFDFGIASEIIPKLERAPRISFSFITEHSAKLIKETLKKIDFFDNNKTLVKNIVSTENKWVEEFKTITNFDMLFNISKKDSQRWVNWGTKVIMCAEKTLLPISEWYYKTKNVPSDKTENIYNKCVSYIENYTKSVNDFFKDTGIKYASSSTENRFEDVQIELLKFSSTLKNEMKTAIFECENFDDKIELLRIINEYICCAQIDSIINYYKPDVQEDLISVFEEMKNIRFDLYLASPESYQLECDRYLETFWNNIETLKKKE